MNRFLRKLAVVMSLLVTGQALAADWPMWGGTIARNMASGEKNLPTKITVGDADGEADPPDLAKSVNIKWAAKLGTQSYGNPTISGGKVFVGTNNEPGKSKEREGDYGVVLCFDEKTGALLWQLTTPKLKAGDVSDFEHVGNCSPPTVEGNRVYLVTNRCEVICLDTGGLANGNDGTFKDEAQYIAGPGEPAARLLPNDADILWVYDMRDELGSFPNQMTSSSVLVMGDRLYVTTSNGRDWTGLHTPSPQTPALICLDKQTGKLLGQEKSGISARTFKCNWSSPSYGMVNGKGLVFFGGDDGFCYAFDPVPVDGVLKEVWRFDCNPPEYRTAADGTPIKFGGSKGPNGILATPVFYENRVYVSIGQDPGQGEGAGAMVCIDAAGSGDITKSGQVWMTKMIGRSLSTPAIADGLVYTADLAGKVYCLDLATGREIWKHDSEGTVWGSPLLADGKIYIGTENATLWVLAAGREKKVIADNTIGGSLLSSPVAANGILYIMTGKMLFATEAKTN